MLSKLAYLALCRSIQLPTPALDAVIPKPYVAHQKMFDAAYPHGRHYYWKAHKLGPSPTRSSTWSSTTPRR